MFSDRLNARIVAVALAGAALALPLAAMAGVVVKSTGPSASRYPVGTKLDDDASITLKDGDVVTVLTADGTRVIRGAGTFRVGDRPKVAADRFASLTRKRAATRVRTGAVRGTADENPTNPSRGMSMSRARARSAFTTLRRCACGVPGPREPAPIPSPMRTALPSRK